MKQQIIYMVRKLHLLEFADKAKFILLMLKYWKLNREFKQKHPDIPLPPPFILYEAMGKPDYTSYYYGGRENAEYFLSLLRKHVDVFGGRICEWGCGPARILRHFYNLLKDYGKEVYGTIIALLSLGVINISGE